MVQRLILIAIACMACAWTNAADAQVRKCTTPDGRPLYTDQRCEALGATPAPATTPGSSAATTPDKPAGHNLYRGGCSRTLQDLVFEITTAIDAQDANRLSSVYHWVGATDASASAVMDRLDAIAHRPLLDISPVSPAPADDVALGSAPVGVPRTTVRRPPVGLRLEQTLANGITPAPVVLGLRRHFGCWWVAL
jgi:hypothetical protein